MKIEIDIAGLASKSLSSDNIIKSDEARSRASGTLTTTHKSAGSVTDAFRHKQERDQAKSVKDAFNVRASVRIVCGLVEGLGAALDSAKAALVKAQSDADKAAHAAANGKLKAVAKAA